RSLGRLLRPMATLLTTCTRGTGHVTCTPREGRNTSREARKQALGTLPMRNGLQHGEAPPCESANACIYNVCHPAPVDERPPCAETFCGKVYHTLYLNKIHVKTIAWRN